MPGRLMKLHAEPGDIILVEYDPSTQRVTDVANTIVNMGIRIPQTMILFVPKGVDFSILTDEQLDAYGLMKKPKPCPE